MAAPAHAFFVPGRVEVLGKHTDYAGGRSLLAAIDRGFTVEIRPGEGPSIRITDAGRSETVDLDAGTGATVSSLDWATYPAAVARRVARDFPGVLGGCRIRLSSDLPAAAGLSSSSALVTAVFLALDALFDISETVQYRAAIPDRESLAGYLGALERGAPYPGLGGEDPGVGTRGGSEDHVAVLCAEAGRLVRYRFEPVAREGAVAMPAGHVFAIAASGVEAEKAGSARARYNRLSDEAARAAALWRTGTGDAHPHLGAILAEPGGLGRLRDVLWCSARAGERDALRRRVRHFAAESDEIVPAAFDALAAGALGAFGEQVDRSQALAEELLGNQVPETTWLARSARELGAVAASAFGAGFGGSVWAMIREPDAPAFLEAWKARYLQAYPDRAGAVFFASPAAGPARAH